MSSRSLIPPERPPAAAAEQPLRFVPPRQHAATADPHDCASAEPFALQVLGDDMRPEFEPGDVVIIEPAGLARDGSFVLAHWRGEWILRQLVETSSGWRLRTLAPDDRGEAVDPSCVRGVVIQRSKPGRRRLAKRYVE